MEKNHFKERCNIRMAFLGIGQKELAKMVGKSVPRLCEAIGGDMTAASASIRVKIEHALLEEINKKRIDMRFEVVEALADEPGINLARVSLILPEDLIYIVTEDGIPVGSWNPQNKTYRLINSRREKT